MYNEAITNFEALSIRKNKSNNNIYGALGLTYHLKGDLDLAIENYHKSLALKPEDTFTKQKLN